MRRVRFGAVVAVLVMLVVSAVVVGCGAADESAAPVRAPSGGGDVFAGAPEGQAVLEGSVQKLTIDVSKGYYDPTVVRVKAGVPLELTFGQGQGCLASVLVPDFGIDQDLTAGSVTVTIPAMAAGEYSFSCGMRMVYGKIVAQ